MRFVRVQTYAVLIALLLIRTLHAQQGEQRVAELGRCPLASGQVILDCRVGYRLFGDLDAQKDNAVIMPSWLNGRSDDLIALFGATPSPLRLVDTSKFFGIAFDAFGDGVSSSPSNSRGQPGPAFPLFTMEDMVNAQYRVLTDVLGLRHIHAVVGLSMGGEQAFAWLLLHPGFIDRAVPIVATPQVTSFDLLSKQIIVEAIESDPGYQHGHYSVQPKLQLANAIGAQIVSAPPYRNQQWPRSSFEDWIKTVEAPQRQDANDRMWQARAVMQHDVLHGRPLAEVAQSTSAVKQLIIVAAEDRMVTPQPALEWARTLSAETYISPGTCAHLIMNCDASEVSSRVLKFLDTSPGP